MATDCQGTWRAERDLGETGIRVLTCSGCGELWALVGSRSIGNYPPGTSDLEIIDHALGQFGS